MGLICVTTDKPSYIVLVHVCHWLIDINVLTRDILALKRKSSIVSVLGPDE